MTKQMEHRTQKSRLGTWALLASAPALILVLGIAQCDTDNDLDGWTVADGDCNDNDDTVYPGAPELCDEIDHDCDGETMAGAIGQSADCAAESCVELLEYYPGEDGYYFVGSGEYYCDLTTDGGGWLLTKDNAFMYGTSWDTSYYNSEGYSWSEVLFHYDSGQVSAHCTYPDSIPDCNNMGFEFSSDGGYWGLALNWGSSTCSLATTSYEDATTYLDGTYDFIISRSISTDTVRLGSLEGISGCTTSDNSGTAYVDIFLR